MSDTELDETLDIEPIHRAILSALGAGVVPAAELFDRVAAQGFDRDDVEDWIIDDPTFTLAADGYFHLPTRADGLRLTAFVDADDAAAGFLRLDPWLAPLTWWLVVDGADAEIDGQPGEVFVESRWLDDRDCDVLVGPEGWLDDLAGGWATVTTTGGGLGIDPCPSPPEPSAVVARALAEGFPRIATEVTTELMDSEEPVELRWSSPSRVFNEALARDLDALLDGPLAPLPDLLQSAGLELRDHLVAEKGHDWDAMTSWQTRNRAVANHDLSEDDADAFLMVTGAALAAIAEPDGLPFGVVDESEVEGAGILLTALLERSEVATAFWSDLEDRGVTDRLGPFVDALSEVMEDVAVVAPSWLRARLAEADGRSGDAAALLEDSVGPQCRHRPVLGDLAGYTADQGRLGRAHELLRRAGLLDLPEWEHEDLDPHVQVLIGEVEGFRGLQPSHGAGRNDPCPCGSGRKFKHCHQADGYLDLADRAAWLSDKMRRYAVQHGETLRHDLAEVLFGPDDRVLLPTAFANSPITLELALWEGKLIDGFAASRGPLLPADEAALIEPWTAARRSVFELGRLVDRRLPLLDVVRGGEVVVDNVHPSRSLVPGIRVLARPVPVGDQWRSFAPMIPLADDGDVDELSAAVLSGDAMALAQALSATLSD